MNGEFCELNDFTAPLVERLRRHPKRVVFTEGEDERILRVAARLVEHQTVLPMLIGNRERISKMAEKNGINMRFVRVISPEENSDFDLFCERYARAEQMFGREVVGDVRALMKDPVRFASMMCIYGLADAMVAGNKMGNAAVTRAVLRYKSEPEKNNPLFTITVMVVDEFKKFGGDGIFFLADTGVNPVPTVENMAYYAVKTGKIARHLLGHEVQISMLSASTSGSVPGIPSERVRAATALAQQMLAAECIMDITVEGEIQVDAALSPGAYNIRAHYSSLRRSSDVLVFPTLDAADITKKMMGLMPSVQMYGQFLEEILFPVALVTRMSQDERLFGTALAVANQAILFHELYPEGVAPIY